jgi:hypothetical protein
MMMQHLADAALGLCSEVAIAVRIVESNADGGAGVVARFSAGTGFCPTIGSRSDTGSTTCSSISASAGARPGTGPSLHLFEQFL